LVAGVDAKVLGRTPARTSTLIAAPFRRRHPAHAHRAGSYPKAWDPKAAIRVWGRFSCELLQHGDHGNQHETADQTELFAKAIQRHHAIGAVSAQKGFSMARRVKTPRIPAPKRRGLNPAVDVINRRAWEAMVIESGRMKDQEVLASDGGFRDFRVPAGELSVFMTRL
jgi:hypothetical protein